MELFIYIMEIFVFIVIALVGCYIFYRLDKKSNCSDGESITVPEENDSTSPTDKDENDESKDETMDTRTLCLELLKKMNCEVSVDPEDENALSFTYQNGHFVINVDDKFIRLSFLFWYDIDLEDLDLVAKARRLINDMNVNQPSPCIVYSIDDEQGKMHVHSIIRTLFVKEIPAIEDFLRYNLNMHFSARQVFVKIIDEKEPVGVK